MEQSNSLLTQSKAEIHFGALTKRNVRIVPYITGAYKLTGEGISLLRKPATSKLKTSAISR